MPTKPFVQGCYKRQRGWSAHLKSLQMLYSHQLYFWTPAVHLRLRSPDFWILSDPPKQCFAELQYLHDRQPRQQTKLSWCQRANGYCKTYQAWSVTFIVLTLGLKVWRTICSCHNQLKVIHGPRRPPQSTIISNFLRSTCLLPPFRPAWLVRCPRGSNTRTHRRGNDTRLLKAHPGRIHPAKHRCAVDSIWVWLADDGTAFRHGAIRKAMEGADQRGWTQDCWFLAGIIEVVKEDWWRRTDSSFFLGKTILDKVIELTMPTWLDAWILLMYGAQSPAHAKSLTKFRGGFKGLHPTYDTWPKPWRGPYLIPYHTLP